MSYSVDAIAISLKAAAILLVLLAVAKLAGRVGIRLANGLLRLDRTGRAITGGRPVGKHPPLGGREDHTIGVIVAVVVIGVLLILLEGGLLGA